jgi:N-methylhydantoinase B
MAKEARIDAVTLEVARNALEGIAEEMNAALIRSSYSPNIKERRDCSSALFDAQGRMIAQSWGMPVHLGAMPFSVKAALKELGKLEPGDVVVLNDPFRGGAHLPDLTFVTPIYLGETLIGYAANRAHHADVGGQAPGSIAGNSSEIYQEGLRIPPVRLWRNNQLDRDLLELILANVRTPQERLGDLRAQFAANETGRRRLLELVRSYGLDRFHQIVEEIFDYSERRLREGLRQLRPGVYRYEDYLDDDGRGTERILIRVAVTLDEERGEVTVDFTGSAPQVEGPVNAVYAVTASATYYTIRCFTDPEVPPNDGAYRPIKLIIPEGTVVNAKPPAAVVGGNLEASQRIVDVLIGALAQAAPEKALAACQGTMNNVALGGIDPRTGEPYTIYETIGGGFGGRLGMDGLDGVHSHMSNTLNTPVEALETAYPLRVERYELRPGTGGRGKWRGGLGIRRDIRVVDHKATLSLLGDRRVGRPYGLFGGEPGASGENVLIRAHNGQEQRLPGKCVIELQSGDVVSIRTPGGGGYGDPKEREQALIERDRQEDKIP